MTIDEIIARAKATYATGVKPVHEQWGDGKTCACLLVAAAGLGIRGVEATSRVLRVSSAYALGLMLGWDNAPGGLTGNEDRDCQAGRADGERARREICGS